MIRNGLIILFQFLLFNMYSYATKRDSLKEQIIINQLAKINSQIVDDFKAGTNEIDKGNIKLADSLYSNVYRKVPNFDVVLRRLSGIKYELGNSKEGFFLAEKAVAIKRSAYNLFSLAYLYSLSDSIDKINKSQKLLEEAFKLPNGNDIDFMILACDIALKKDDLNFLKMNTLKLSKFYPKSIDTHYYLALQFIIEEKWNDAYREILIAKKLGLPQETVQKLMNEGVQTRITLKKYGISFLVVLTILISVLILLFIIGILLSKSTIKTFEKQLKDKATIKNYSFVKNTYHSLINISGIYFYFSIPFILILTIFFVITIIYIAFQVNDAPYRLIGFITIASFFSIYSIIRTLLAKRIFIDPGRMLKEIEAPKLYQLVRDVALIMGTRPIEEIRITTGTDLAVFERGTRKERFNDTSTRVLILGIGILKNFKQHEFKSILAHEYGHFSHRDTVGGDVALRVRNDMHIFFHSISEKGLNTWWNFTFLFVWIYHFIFIRISHGATRLQEIMADRVAAQLFGKETFKDGLTYVIRQEIEFIKYVNIEIETASTENRRFKNLYKLEGNLQSSIDEDCKKEMEQKTYLKDSHPSAIDRFYFINDINANSINNETTYIKDLFTNWDNITNEMTTLVENTLKSM